MAVLLFLHLYDAFYEILQSLTFLGQTHRVIRLLVTRVIVTKKKQIQVYFIKKIYNFAELRIQKRFKNFSLRLLSKILIS